MTVIRQGHSGLVEKPNRIINPFMRYDQRHASTSAQKIDVDAAGGQLYTLDRWFVDDTHSGGSIDMWREAFSPGQQEVPGEPRYFMRYQAATPSGGTQPVRILQRIEDVTSLIGDTGVHLYVRADTAVDLDVTLVQKFGSGGGSADVVLAAYSQPLTSAWAELRHQFDLPSILGKVIGSGGDDCIELRLSFPENTAIIFDLANVSVVEGAAKPAHELWRSMQTEFGLCQRFYEKTYSLDVVPGTAITDGVVGTGGQPNSNIGWGHFYQVPKRSVPTHTYYDTLGNINRVSANFGGNIVVTFGGNTEFNFWGGFPGTPDYTHFHYTAEAEL